MVPMMKQKRQWLSTNPTVEPRMRKTRTLSGKYFGRKKGNTFSKLDEISYFQLHFEMGHLPNIQNWSVPISVN